MAFLYRFIYGDLRVGSVVVFLFFLIEKKVKEKPPKLNIKLHKSRTVTNKTPAKQLAHSVRLHLPSQSAAGKNHFSRLERKREALLCTNIVQLKKHIHLRLLIALRAINPLIKSQGKPTIQRLVLAKQVKNLSYFLRKLRAFRRYACVAIHMFWMPFLFLIENGGEGMGGGIFN